MPGKLYSTSLYKRQRQITKNCKLPKVDCKISSFSTNWLRIEHFVVLFLYKRRILSGQKFIFYLVPKLISQKELIGNKQIRLIFLICGAVCKW